MVKTKGRNMKAESDATEYRSVISGLLCSEELEQKIGYGAGREARLRRWQGVQEIANHRNQSYSPPRKPVWVRRPKAVGKSSIVMQEFLINDCNDNAAYSEALGDSNDNSRKQLASDSKDIAARTIYDDGLTSCTKLCKERECNVDSCCLKGSSKVMKGNAQFLKKNLLRRFSKDSALKKANGLTIGSTRPIYSSVESNSPTFPTKSRSVPEQLKRSLPITIRNNNNTRCRTLKKPGSGNKDSTQNNLKRIPWVNATISDTSTSRMENAAVKTRFDAKKDQFFVSHMPTNFALTAPWAPRQKTIESSDGSEVMSTYKRDFCSRSPEKPPKPAGVTSKLTYTPSKPRNVESHAASPNHHGEDADRLSTYKADFAPLHDRQDKSPLKFEDKRPSSSGVSPNHREPQTTYESDYWKVSQRHRQTQCDFTDSDTTDNKLNHTRDVAAMNSEHSESTLNQVDTLESLSGDSVVDKRARKSSVLTRKNRGRTIGQKKKRTSSCFSTQRHRADSKVITSSGDAQLLSCNTRNSLVGDQKIIKHQEYCHGLDDSVVDVPFDDTNVAFNASEKSTNAARSRPLNGKAIIMAQGDSHGVSKHRPSSMDLPCRCYGGEKSQTLDRRNRVAFEAFAAWDPDNEAQLQQAVAEKENASHALKSAKGALYQKRKQLLRYRKQMASVRQENERLRREMKSVQESPRLPRPMQALRSEPSVSQADTSIGVTNEMNGLNRNVKMTCNQLADREDEIKNLLMHLDNEKEKTLTLSRLQSELTESRNKARNELREKETVVGRLQAQMRAMEKQTYQQRLELQHLQELLDVSGDKMTREKEALKKAALVQRERATRSERASDAMNNELLRKDAELLRARAMMERHQAEREKIEVEKAHSESEIIELKNRLVEMERRMTTTSHQSVSEQHEITHELHTKLQEVGNVKAENILLQGKILVLEEQVKSKSLELENLRTTLKTYEGVMDDYKHRLQDSELHMRDLSTKLDERSQRSHNGDTHSHAEIEEVRQTLQRRIGELETIPAQLQSTEAKLQRANSKMRLYEQQLAEQTQLISDLKIKFEARTNELESSAHGRGDGATSAQVTDLVAKMSSLETRCREMESSQRDLMAKLSDRDRDVRNLTSQLSERQQATDALKQQLHSEQNGVHREHEETIKRSHTTERILQSRLTELESQLQRARTELSCTKKCKDETERSLESKVRDLRDRLEKLESTNRGLTNYVGFLKTSYSTTFGDSGIGLSKQHYSVTLD